ncbi:MAG: hypothetical protein KGR22_00220 [Planctomycetes bacterium]|nr:hypothetical protein [Planctomycetota bacterium]
MTRFVLATVVASTLASAASASFTGYSVERVLTAGGNSRYSVYANFNASNLVFLNAFSFVNVSGTMNARHQDFFTADGLVGTWTAGTSVSAADRGEDSWVTASGLATSSGWGTALDPGFTAGGEVGDINNGAGWYDATPGTANAIGAGGTQGGFRMLIAQIVRSGDDSAQAVSNHSLQLSWKVAGTTTAIFGNGSFTIPAPGAMALLGLAGLTGRRRR